MNEEEAGAEIAFRNARVILERLRSIGVENPYVELFVDGSGTVHLGKRELLGARHVSSERAFEIIGSERMAWNATAEDVIIEFCESLKNPNYGEKQ